MREKTALRKSKDGGMAARERLPVSAPRRGESNHNPVLRFQRMHGNRFMQRLLRSGYIQAKLTVSQPGDRYEQEADRVMNEVMSMTAPLNAHDGAGHGAGQNCSGCDAQVHRRAVGEGVATGAERAPGRSTGGTSGLQTRVAALQGRGERLPDSVRAYFEPRFGRDFSDVRVHTNSSAAQMAGALSAQAFTVGPDMVFAAGQYAPDSTEGKRLIAHELTHVVQQSGAAQSVARASGNVRNFHDGPAIQRRLVTFGTLADVNALLGLIGPDAGLNLQLNIATNQVQITGVFPGAPASPALRARLTAIINHPTQHAEVIVARGQPQVLVGAFPAPRDLTVTRVQQLDIDDILAIEAGAPGNGVAAAAHEIEENFRAHAAVPVAGVDRFPAAHRQAEAVENAVATELVGQPSRRVATIVVPTGPNTATFIVDYEDYFLVFTQTLNPATQDLTVSNARQAPPVIVGTTTIDNFASGSDVVPHAAAANLAIANIQATGNPTATVLVEGFSDAGGAAAANRQTSLRRANNVRAALVAGGVGADRIRTVGRGAVNFVAPNDTAANRALNRRVVITVRRPGP